MSRGAEFLGTVLGLVVVALAVVAFQFSRLPLQPRHPAMARVVAIAAWEGKLYAYNDNIVVRNAHGTGQFTMRDVDVRCHVGDIVPVQQQGITLTRAAGTCR